MFYLTLNSLNSRTIILIWKIMFINEGYCHIILDYATTRRSNYTWISHASTIAGKSLNMYIILGKRVMNISNHLFCKDAAK